MLVSKKLFGVPACSLLLLACAGDPNKEVQSAAQADQEKQNELAAEQAELNQEQTEERTELNNEQVEERAELEHDQADPQAELSAEKREARAEGSADVTKAQADLNAERQVFVANADKRIEKAEAQANEALTKSKTLPAPKKGRFEAAWNEYKARHADAVEKTRQARAAASSDWSRVKPQTEKSLTLLEDSADNVEKAF